MLLAEYQSWSNIFGVKLNRIGVTRTSKVWYHFTFLLVKASKYLRLDWECKLGFLFPSHHKQPDREIQITEYTCDMSTPVNLCCGVFLSCSPCYVLQVHVRLLAWRHKARCGQQTWSNLRLIVVFVEISIRIFQQWQLGLANSGNWFVNSNNWDSLTVTIRICNQWQLGFVNSDN